MLEFFSIWIFGVWDFIISIGWLYLKAILGHWRCDSIPCQLCKEECSGHCMFQTLLKANVPEACMCKCRHWWILDFKVSMASSHWCEQGLIYFISFQWKFTNKMPSDSDILKGILYKMLKIWEYLLNCMEKQNYSLTQNLI